MTSDQVTKTGTESWFQAKAKMASPVVATLVPLHGFLAKACLRIFSCSVKSAPLALFALVILSLLFMELTCKRKNIYDQINVHLPVS